MNSQMNLLLWVIVSVVSVISQWTGSQPMLCQSIQSRVSFSIPQTIFCEHTAVETTPGSEFDRPIQQPLQLYKRNYFQYHSKAHVCKKVKTITQVYTSFGAFSHDKRTEQQTLVMDAADCSAAATYHSTSLGSMIQKGEVWQTENRAEIVYPGGWFWSCCK